MQDKNEVLENAWVKMTTDAAEEQKIGSKGWGQKKQLPSGG